MLSESDSGAAGSYLRLVEWIDGSIGFQQDLTRLRPALGASTIKRRPQQRISEKQNYFWFCVDIEYVTYPIDNSDTNTVSAQR